MRTREEQVVDERNKHMQENSDGTNTLWRNVEAGGTRKPIATEPYSDKWL